MASSDLESLLTFYQSARNKKTFEAGIENALRLILTNPKFLFRMETDPAGAPVGSMHPLDDLELASRLSFFLWSTIPMTQRLITSASCRLMNPLFEQQVKRTLNRFNRLKPW